MMRMVARWRWIVVVAGSLACGPNVADPSADGSDDSGAASTEVGTSTTATSVSTTATSTTTTVGTTAADTGPPGESGCLDGCGMCPWDPCAPNEYCDRDTLTCVPLPDALPACEDARWVVEPAVIPIAAPAIDLTFVDVDGVGGRELVLVDAMGNLEIRTPTLDPWATSVLADAVLRIAATDLEPDGTGDLAALTDGYVQALAGDGMGAFMLTSEIEAIGSSDGAVGFGDWNDDGRTDVAVTIAPLDLVHLRATLADAMGLVVEHSLMIDALATAIAGIPASRGTGDRMLVALADGSLDVIELVDGTVLTPTIQSQTQWTAVDVAGFLAFEHLDTYVAALGSNDTGAVLELFDPELAPIGTWPLPQVGTPRRIAAFGDPWAFAKDLLVVLGDAPTIVLVVEPWSELPCVIEVPAGPGVSVALGYTYPLVATEDANLVRLDFP
jgi:hypothetical protein